MKIRDYLNNLKRPINKALDKYLPSEREYPKTIHKAMRYSVFSGGKRIRPILAIESCKACGGSLKDILPAACAIELVHTYSLIHDDLPAMDDDDYRRGKLTSHKVFGDANAILAGDALLTLAFNIISKKMSPKIGLKVIRELSGAIGTKGMVGGQVADLEFSDSERRDFKEDKNLLRHINYLKTAKLFEASAKIGAIAADSGARKIDAMAKFGKYFGMAFQIADDIIDGEGYVRIFGIDIADKDSKDLTKKAKDILKIFGKKVDNLKDITDLCLDLSRR